MKKIALWLAIMALGLCLGCQGSMMDSIIQNKHKHKNHVEINLKFKRGQMIDLKIGGRGQIIDLNVNGNRRLYHVRIQTDEGPKYMLFQEFELEIIPWDPS